MDLSKQQRTGIPPHRESSSSATRKLKMKGVTTTTAATTGTSLSFRKRRPSTSTTSYFTRKREKIQESTNSGCFRSSLNSEGIPPPACQKRPQKLLPIYSTNKSLSDGRKIKKPVSNVQYNGILHCDRNPYIPEDSSSFPVTSTQPGTPVSNSLLIDLWCNPEQGGCVDEFPLASSSETIPQEHWGVASSWISVVGRDLTCSLFSRDWFIRETALRRLSREVANTLRNHVHDEHCNYLDKVWRTTTEILNRMVEDKIYKVYCAAIRCLQSLLTHTHCLCFISEEEIKTCLRSVVVTIILRCADGKRRISELSTSVILELWKGPRGYLNSHAFTDLSDFLAKIFFEEPDSRSWQWTLGVLVILDRVLLDDGNQSGFLLMILDFSFQHLNHRHTNINKLARKVFVASARMTDDETFVHVWDGLASLNHALQERIKRQLKSHHSHHYLKDLTILDSSKALGKYRICKNRKKLRNACLSQNLPYDTPRGDPQPQNAALTSISDVAYMEKTDWIKGSLLGTGGYSTCFQSRDIRSGTLMAVKQIALDSLSSTVEVDIMRRYGNHAHILRLFGAAVENGFLNVFIEWMPGGSVAHLLETYGAFNEEVILKYSYQLLNGLEYLHRHSVLHRDLKGANLLIDNSGHHLKIGDFGTALVLTDSVDPQIRGGPRGEELRGTIAFMAPEVLRGENYGLSSDVWSVGCCIIEMATQRPPWSASDISNHLALIFKIACSMGPPDVPEHLSLHLRDIVMSCLRLQPQSRPSSIQLLQHPIFF